MKVLIADKFEESGIEGLKAIGCDVVCDPNLKDETLVDAVRLTQADVLIVRSTRVTEAVLDAGRLSLVVRAGAGYNTIDVKAASARGIYVSNCPGKNAIAVAELAFSLILALDRRIADNVSDLRDGKWDKKEYGKARGLHGRTLGLIGLGRIGCEMIARAKAFGMNVIGWSRSLTPEAAAEMGISFRQTFIEVANDCDILSIHLALAPDTLGVINADIFEVRVVRHQHISRRNNRSGRLDAGHQDQRHTRRSRCLRRGTDSGNGRFYRPDRPVAGRLWHASYGSHDRSGPGSHRGRDCPRYSNLQRDRQGS